MKILIIFLLCTMMTGCGPKKKCDPPISWHKEKVVNKLLHHTRKNIQSELGLIPFGEGARMMYQIEILSLSFQYRSPVTAKEGRRLLLEAVQRFTDEINADTEIRPYLSVYPFPPEKVEIRIFLTNRDGSNPSPEHFQVIRCSEGELKFLSDSNTAPFLKTTYRETYEEALKKI